MTDPVSGFRNTVTIEDPEANNDMKVNDDGSINIGRVDLVATVFDATISGDSSTEISTVGIDRMAIQALVTEVTPFELYIQLQASNDGTNFVTIPVTRVHLLGTDQVMWNIPIPEYKFLQVYTNIISGSIALKLIVNSRAFQ